jgi:5-methylcytosine-specific restriction endonuclease McrA
MPFKKPNRNWKFPAYCGGDKSAWQRLSLACKKRDGFRCQACGAPGKQVGGYVELNACHILSKSKGGSDSLDNLTTKCVECHAKEHRHMQHKLFDKLKLW